MDFNIRIFFYFIVLYFLSVSAWYFLLIILKIYVFSLYIKLIYSIIKYKAFFIFILEVRFLAAYEEFASVYDIFMDNMDYDMWVEYIHRIWDKENIKPKLIAELGCGTGNITGRLAKEGYDMIGIDISEEMLSVAKTKAEEDGSKNILYLLQDMTEFELYGTVDVILCLCDSINYITEYDDLVQVFKLVNNYLEPNGLFIFDINTEYKFKHILGDNTFADTEENAAYIWQNFYDENEKINEYYVNFFIKNNDDTYERTEEYHYERAYKLDEIKNALSEAGLIFENSYNAFSFDEPKYDSQRVYIIAREHGKIQEA